MFRVNYLTIFNIIDNNLPARNQGHFSTTCNFIQSNLCSHRNLKWTISRSTKALSYLLLQSSLIYFNFLYPEQQEKQFIRACFSKFCFWRKKLPTNQKNQRELKKIKIVRQKQNFEKGALMDGWYYSSKAWHKKIRNKWCKL